jgi:hypothetical protein
MKNDLNEYKNDSRTFCKQVNKMREAFQTKQLSCRSTDSDILSGKADILNRCLHNGQYHLW